MSVSISLLNAENAAAAAGFFARNTSASGVRVENARSRARTASRQRRFMRFLCVAFPATAFDTIHANDVRLARGSGETESEKRAPCRRLPVRSVAKSVRESRVLSVISLRRESRTSFATPTNEHIAPSAAQKAVRARSLPLFWLIGPFHHAHNTPLPPFFQISERLRAVAACSRSATARSFSPPSRMSEDITP